jgi:hypothetical protein
MWARLQSRLRRQLGSEARRYTQATIGREMVLCEGCGVITIVAEPDAKRKLCNGCAARGGQDNAEGR